MNAQPIDYANSYMTFFVKSGANIARIQLDAACTLMDETTGKSAAFYLIAPCRSERCYEPSQLFQMPDYEFCGVWGEEEHQIIRTHWTSDRDNRQYGPNSTFEAVHLDIRRHAQARRLESNAAIVRATLDNRPLIARTHLRDAARGRRAVLEYPVKTMNVRREPVGFQTDTGPVLWPDFTSPAAHWVERFELAYVAYNRLDKAEFILRKPRPVLDDGDPAHAVTDYTVVVEVAAENELWCG